MSTQQSYVVYFCHGLPGSEYDATLIKNIDQEIQLIAPNLLKLNSEDLLKDFDEQTKNFEPEKIIVTGFSIGAMVAIKLAAARPERVGQLKLISPAAPLSLGNFLPLMSGKPVFDLAIKHPKLLSMLTFGQGLLSSIAPNFLIKQLFSKCGLEEKRLLDEPLFRDVLKQSFSNSFRKHPKNYVQIIKSYVEDWSEYLNEITCPVDIWHGDKDTWAPIEMSHKLVENISIPTHLHILEDAEHYSTLTRVALTLHRPT